MENKDDIKVGEVLRDKRKSKGYSLRKLEELSGISYSHLSKIERGEIKPTKETINSICKALEEDPEPILLLAGYPTDNLFYKLFSSFDDTKYSKIEITFNNKKSFFKDDFVLDKNRMNEVLKKVLNVKTQTLKDEEVEQYKKWKDAINLFEKHNIKPDDIFQFIYVFKSIIKSVQQQFGIEKSDKT
jgi:transcriptional regulator with XRE-family HTH domain